jgi:hypothetical protein
MRYYFCLALPVAVLPPSAGELGLGFTLVLLLRLAHACLARSGRARAAAVALPAIAVRAEKDHRQAALACDSPKRFQPHENLDGGPQLVRASTCSPDFFRQSQRAGS